LDAIKEYNMPASSMGSDSPRKPLKTIITYKDKRFPTILRLRFKEGGLLPDSLTGMYNSQAEADKAISDYNEGYTRKKIYPTAPKNDIPQRSEVKDGEEKDASRV